MSPEDFPQFPDPRVRSVMAAAANLVEDLAERFDGDWHLHSPYMQEKFEELKTALFAAQHSKPTSDVAIRIITDAVMPPGKFALVYPEAGEWRAPIMTSDFTSPNPCGGDHGNSYECHACVAGRKV